MPLMRHDSVLLRCCQTPRTLGATCTRLASTRMLLHVRAVQRLISIMRSFPPKNSTTVEWQEASVSCFQVRSAGWAQIYIGRNGRALGSWDAGESTAGTVTEIDT